MTKSKNTASASKDAIKRLAESGFDHDPAVVAFREDIVLHAKFQAALDEIAERMQYGEQQSITAVIGPTGSGKTALVREFGYQFSEAMKAVAIPDRTTLLCVELAAPEQGPFNWKHDFYVPSLVALGEPCTTKKVNVEELRARLLAGNTKTMHSSQPQTNHDLRELFYGALERDKTIGALFDESNHFRRPASKSGIFTQYDSLKSRSNACRTHFTLLGTIELVDIFRQSGAISKRVRPVWLGPYGPSQSDRELFGSATLSISQKLEGRIDFVVEKHLDELYEGALGLCGLAHDWFDRALIRSVSLGKHKIKWSDMQAAASDPIQLSGIIDDLLRYRSVVQGVQAYFQERKSMLFLPPIVAEEDAAKKSRRRSTKPGERAPVRDKVGA